MKSSNDLREVERLLSSWVNNKVIDHIDELSRRFIEALSLAFVSSRRPDGVLDMTPGGDPPGFVHVLGERLIAIPDRPGNKRMDTFENVFHDPNIGIIFVIPGHRDTLRVSGKAAVVQGAELGKQLAVNGRPSELLLLMGVERVLCHWSKAFVRRRVWQPDDWPDTSNVPTLAEMMKRHGKMALGLQEIEGGINDDRENNLY